MKELTIEEKARRYDEAIDKFDVILNLSTVKESGTISVDDVRKILPELKESDDEIVIAALKSGINGLLKKEYHLKGIGGISFDRILAWLEKQAQKPDTNCLLNWSETDEKMLQSLEGIVKDYWAKAEQEKNEIKIREASNVSYFLKTIQKSPLCWIKCSDELPNRDGIYLVVTDGMHNDVYDMARYDSIEGWHKASEIIYWMPIPKLNNKSIIEQKPAEWHREDEQNLNACLGYIRDEFLRRWLKDIVHVKYDKAAWSEDDNKHFERILKELKNQWQRPLNRPYLEEIESDYNWLNSIKDRVQPKQEWGEEDEARFKSCIKVLQTSDGYDTINAKWLKSLRHQNTWKPSDAQMKALSDINVTGGISYAGQGQELINLYNALKKLRGE